MRPSSRLHAVFLIAGVSGLTACQSAAPDRTQSQVTVAAAANLTAVFQSIGTRFEAATHIHPVFSFASTAQLTQQIENAAPFDVFTAADATHIDELDREHLLLAGSRAIYARGVLALWIPPGGKAEIARIEDLAKPEVRFIAIAKPELAPYGQASVETLRSLRLWDKIQPKIVYAENINGARQYGQSHNADAVFTAYSLVLHAPGKVIRVDDNLHQPIDQALGIVAASAHLDAARKFVDFLLHGEGRDILRDSGYRTP
ncbi:MAG TPA: molybdate ABC transporter substrate-binding protein [Bryobacteraceae bacterium]|nr:molybdate ABC transporter substrate-binding protein [Bryobacteraceae bacterium]